MVPTAVGDLNDNDNNHELCLGTAGCPVHVFFPAGALANPNADLDPDTEIAVSSPIPTSEADTARDAAAPD